MYAHVKLLMPRNGKMKAGIDLSNQLGSKDTEGCGVCFQFANFYSLHNQCMALYVRRL